MMGITVTDSQFLFTEKYRPSTVDECILPDRISQIAKNLIAKGEISNLLFHGSGGVGKTTLAKAICRELGCDFIVINGSDENGIDTLRNKMTSYASSVSMDGKPKIIIIDEADYLNPNSIQPALRNFIEYYSKNCRFIFTCNYKSRIIEPLHSRLVSVDFELTKEEKKVSVVKFCKRACDILDHEGIEYEKPVLAKIVKNFFPDFRRILGELQKSSTQTGGSITGESLGQFKDTDISELITFLSAKDFTKMRGWVANNVEGGANVFSRLYQSLNATCAEKSIPNAVLILADYQHKGAFVSDHELNLVACCIELMANCEWK